MIQIKNKKAVGVSFTVKLILATFMFLILMLIFPRLLESGKDEISFGISQTEDYDGDLVVDYYDKCKCTAADTENGCPNNVNPNVNGFCEYEKCSKDRVPAWAQKNCEGKLL